jgi:hypothetical protein
MPVPESDLSQVIAVLTRIADALTRLATVAEEQEKRQSGGTPFSGYRETS